MIVENEYYILMQKYDGEVAYLTEKYGFDNDIRCALKANNRIAASLIRRILEIKYNIYLDIVPLKITHEWCNNEYHVKEADDNGKSKRHGRWIYWDGWCGNHDMRIEDAVCSECGYKHPTVRWEQGDPRSDEFVLNKLKDECPKCGAIMQKE